MFRVTFSKETVKELKGELQKAYERGDLRAVRRLSVLVMIGERISLAVIVALWGVSVQTVYNWLRSFVREQGDGGGIFFMRGLPRSR